MFSTCRKDGPANKKAEQGGAIFGIYSKRGNKLRSVHILQFMNSDKIQIHFQNVGGIAENGRRDAPRRPKEVPPTGSLRARGLGGVASRFRTVLASNHREISLLIFLKCQNTSSETPSPAFGNRAVNRRSSRACLLKRGCVPSLSVRGR